MEAPIVVETGLHSTVLHFTLPLNALLPCLHSIGIQWSSDLGLRSHESVKTPCHSTYLFIFYVHIKILQMLSIINARVKESSKN